MSNIHREDWRRGVDDEWNVGEPQRKTPRWLSNMTAPNTQYRDGKRGKRYGSQPGR